MGAITVSNGQGVQITGNTFDAPAALTPAPQAIRLDLCRDVTVADNKIARRDQSPDPIVLTARADKASIVQQGNQSTR